MAFKGKKQQDKKFPLGVLVKTIKTKFGDIIKIGINVESFCENEINESGFINFDLKMSKNGNYYAELQEPNK